MILEGCRVLEGTHTCLGTDALESVLSTCLAESHIHMCVCVAGGGGVVCIYMFLSVFERGGVMDRYHTCLYVSKHACIQTYRNRGWQWSEGTPVATCEDLQWSG